MFVSARVDLLLIVVGKGWDGVAFAGAWVGSDFFSYDLIYNGSAPMERKVLF